MNFETQLATSVHMSEVQFALVQQICEEEIAQAVNLKTRQLWLPVWLKCSLQPCSRPVQWEWTYKTALEKMTASA